MDLDEGNAHRGDGIANGNARVRIGSRIDNHSGIPFSGCMDGIHNRPLAVRLEGIDLQSQGFAMTDALMVYLLNRSGAVHRFFAHPQEIQIGAMDDENLKHGGSPDDETNGTKGTDTTAEVVLSSLPPYAFFLSAPQRLSALAPFFSYKQLGNRSPHMDGGDSLAEETGNAEHGDFWISGAPGLINGIGGHEFADL